uniref:C-type lectin domain-containing protein n=1 Tax=Kryptolebias marmoratus TaxID=37003 RepID=A0A3Q3G138_KRYMA
SYSCHLLSKILGYICELTGGQNPQPTASPGQSKFTLLFFYAAAAPALSVTVVSLASDGHCDQGYLLYGNFCYHFEIEDVKNWRDAEARCVSEQGHLVSFQRQEELSFLTVIQQTPTGISLWMGGHDSVTEGGWEWTDGSPFRYIHWNTGNPDNYNGEDCLSILINSGYWNDDNCQNKRGYICKRRGEKRCCDCC